MAAVTAVHLTDPERRKEQAEQEARDAITEATLKQIAANAEKLAAEVAPKVGADWVDAMRAQYMQAQYSLGEGNQVPPVLAGANGHSPKAPARRP